MCARSIGFVTEKFGISHIRLVTGWSMGALQTFHWGALYPDMHGYRAILWIGEMLAAQFRVS